MHISYDPEVDIAYISIDQTLKYKSTTSFKIENLFPFGVINIDLSEDDKIVGFEIANASRYLSQYILRIAQKPN